MKRKSKYIPWNELLRRTFNVELKCANCKGDLRLIGLIKTAATIKMILAAMALPTLPPAAAPARAPRVAGFVAALKAVPDGAAGETVFSRTVVVWGNELGVGQTHDRGRLPLLTIGNAGGALRTGQFLNFPSIISRTIFYSRLAGPWGSPT